MIYKINKSWSNVSFHEELLPMNFIILPTNETIKGMNVLLEFAKLVQPLTLNKPDTLAY